MLAQVVIALTEKYLDKGHHIYADQLYSSVSLVDELERRGTGYTGTLNKCRRQLPSVVRAKSFKMNKGETRAWRDGKKMVLAWRDKGKPTIMISSVHQATMIKVNGRRGKSGRNLWLLKGTTRAWVELIRQTNIRSTTPLKEGV